MFSPASTSWTADKHYSVASTSPNLQYWEELEKEREFGHHSLQRRVASHPSNMYSMFVEMLTFGRKH